MKSEILLKENKYYKLESNNIIILFNIFFNEYNIYYYINDKLIGKIYKPYNYEDIINSKFENPIKIYLDYDTIRINDLEISNLLRSEDKTIMKMGITILFDKYNIKI